jgi:hypothetical protein
MRSRCPRSRSGHPCSAGGLAPIPSVRLAHTIHGGCSSASRRRRCSYFCCSTSASMSGRDRPLRTRVHLRCARRSLHLQRAPPPPRSHDLEQPPRRPRSRFALQSANSHGRRYPAHRATTSSSSGTRPGSSRRRRRARSSRFRRSGRSTAVSALFGPERTGGTSGRSSRVVGRRTRSSRLRSRFPDGDPQPRLRSCSASVAEGNRGRMVRRVEPGQRFCLPRSGV